MKSYDEIYRDVLRRRDEQIAKQRRRIAVAGSVLPAVMVSLAAVAGVAALRGLPENVEDSKELGGASAADTSETESAADTSTTEAVVTTLVVYAQPGYIDIDKEDFVEMNVIQLEQYFGAQITPYIPKGMTGESDRCGIYVKDGTPYWDAFRQTYKGDDGSWLEITICKCVQIERTPIANGQTVYSNGIEVVMFGGRAEFVKNGTSFYIDSGGLLEDDELDKVIASLTEDAEQTIVDVDSLDGYKAELGFVDIKHTPTADENYYSAAHTIVTVTAPDGSTAKMNLGAINSMVQYALGGPWYTDENGGLMGGVKLWSADYNGEKRYMVSVQYYRKDFIEMYDVDGDMPAYVTIFFGIDSEVFENGSLRTYDGERTYGLYDSFRVDGEIDFGEDGHDLLYILRCMTEEPGENAAKID